MQIVALDTIRVGAYPNLCYVRVHTDEGISGLGETFFGAEAVESWIHETAAQYLLQNNPLDIERHWHALEGFLGFRSSGVENRGRSAIDMALWDLWGKATGQPLYQLLGGRTQSRVRVYNTCAGSEYVRTPPNSAGAWTDNWGLKSTPTSGPYEDLVGFLDHPAELAESLLYEGYTGMKIWPFDLYADQSRGQYLLTEDLKQGLKPFEAIRRVVGDRIDIMLELHSRWNLPVAKQIATAVAPYHPAWIEDPIRMDNLDALKAFHDTTSIPTTASETLATRWSFREALERQAVDIVMFDPSWVGGVSESKKVTTLAEAYQLPIAPHDCLGPVQFSAAVHIAVNAPNLYIQEVVRSFVAGWYPELVTNVPRVNAGYVEPLDGPGLGTELRPERLAQSDVSVRRSPRR